MITNNTNTFNSNNSNPNLIIPAVDPGWTATDVYPLQQINGDISIQQAVGGSDLGDAYSFTITQAGQYSFNLNGLTADADLRVHDSQGNLIDFSELTNNQSESLTLELSQGDYYVTVPSFDGIETNYNLSISNSSNAVDVLNPPPEPSEPGNTFDTAHDFGTFTNAGNNIITFADAVGGTDGLDLFKFTVTESQQFNAAIENLTADADLALFDSNEQMIAYSFTDGIVDTESLSTTISPGTYILGVESYDGMETSYSLNITSGVDSSSVNNGFGEFEYSDIPMGVAPDFGGYNDPLNYSSPDSIFV